MPTTSLDEPRCTSSSIPREPGMLSVQNVNAGYGVSQVLFDVSIDVNAGEVVTLLGRNGMGKTTTILSIMGILPLRSGEIVFDGKRVNGWPSFRVARLGLGLVPEGRQVFPNLTVKENIAVMASHTGRSERRWTYDSVLELARDLVGPAAMLTGGVGAADIDRREWHTGFLFSRALTIGGGTSEVQRNIIAERVLGLPREPE